VQHVYIPLTVVGCGDSGGAAGCFAAAADPDAAAGASVFSFSLSSLSFLPAGPAATVTIKLTM